MLIRAETAGQSLRIHGKKGWEGGGGRKRKRERGKKRETEGAKKRERESWEGKVKTWALWKRMPPAVHSWVTLLWTRDPKTSLKGGWVGQWSGRNRAQAEASQRSHKRPHISDSAVQEAGGEEGGGGGGGGGGLWGCGGLVFSIRNMRQGGRARGKEGSLLSLTFCPPGVFALQAHVSLISLISFHLAPSPSSPC